MRDEHKAILRVLGHFFLEHDQAGKALVVLQALRAVYPADAGIARSLSYAYLQAGRYQDALDAARQADAEPDRGSIDLLQGKALWGLGRTDEARACLARYLASRSLE
ncbi:MAG: tetratricopeptide repeat protein [Candidatus Competibacteraceae bacterium]|jgi:predicted Zn-dependent protease|nr:tetratricopeptide repeat protein [Candidatus Competibacteraceae bacterium]MBK8896465.1 tetratricopeptide repeat protein [Candidatus Competibacteraceae bacterium]MBK8964066.1 tetratricopeptide repeat protein [Candidatus Competibacteraceae bacterium]